MPADTTVASEAQAADEAKPQAGDPPAQAADAQPEGSADNEGPPADLAVLQRELKEARREAAQYRTKVRTYEDAQKTETERNAERIAELEQKLAASETRAQEQRLQMASFAAARKLGFRNPEIAHRLLNGADVEFAEDGSPRNVETLLAAIAKAEPYLVASQTPDYGGGPRGQAPNAGVDMNARIRRATGRA